MLVPLEAAFPCPLKRPMHGYALLSPVCVSNKTILVVDKLFYHSEALEKAQLHFASCIPSPTQENLSVSISSTEFLCERVNTLRKKY